MCRVLKVSRSSYYRWLNRTPSKREIETEKVIGLIHQIYEDSRGRYGSPKITEELNKQGIKISRPRVARLMKKEGLMSIIHRKYKVCTTDSNHNNPVAKNLLDQNFSVSSPGNVWVSDITYIPTDQGWLYLTIIMDLFDRKIIGWALSSTLKTTDTVIPAFKMANINRKINKKLIFHSDRGVQYTSNEFKHLLNQTHKNIKQSMSRKGNCYDNAVAENFFKIIKSELIYHETYKNHQEAKMDIFEFIEIWYNRKRSHQKLQYMTPVEFENKYYLTAA